MLRRIETTGRALAGAVLAAAAVAAPAAAAPGAQTATATRLAWFFGHGIDAGSGDDVGFDYLLPSGTVVGSEPLAAAVDLRRPVADLSVTQGAQTCWSMVNPAGATAAAGAEPGALTDVSFGAMCGGRFYEVILDEDELGTAVGPSYWAFGDGPQRDLVAFAGTQTANESFGVRTCEGPTAEALSCSAAAPGSYASATMLSGAAMTEVSGAP